jgi:DNA topoisomerase-1
VPAICDPADAARLAGLRYVSDEEPGIARRRCGSGFTYRDGRGTIRDADARARIDRLAIPPAWTEVWICPDDRGHIQATGRDDRGRKQYRYHDRWRAARDADKFEQLATFGVQLAKIRRQVALDLGRSGLPRARVLALVVRLLDETLVRVGNPQYARDESFGLTTLEPRHVEVGGGEVVFEFTGKHGIEHEVTVEDRRLASLVAACDDLGGERLFTYREGGEVIEVRSDDVNDYLHEIAGPAVTARDFRTWGGTVTVVEALGPTAPPDGERATASAYLAAVDVAAARLGNTRDVCRSSYVHPVVADAHASGDLAEAWRRSRRTRRLTRAERATLRVLVDAAAAL